ncbi:efflux RND transporter periplasmic adaptor subunit [Thioalkalivibrio sp. AKL12]|uniref:efflux RND transporter periplasmic adaptor subunit n=1 Tax=Thioalkalivibrio sp. AKL12 TaxID=1158159 RepID=UPI00037D9A53|nr:efflux RND transporter periplasmic adaptor subunit [Thioalkalivibrio sp. AKL12]
MHHLRSATPVTALILGWLLLVLLPGCAAESEEEDEAAPEVVEVPVRSLENELVSISRTYTARTRSPREVEVRARVSGVLESRRYEEGEQIERGAEMFRIDPSPYAVRVRSGEASLERAEAERRQAEREWERVLGLYEDNAASGRERDEARSQLELAEAEVAAAEAALAEARLDLDYTSVVSPLDGVGGLEERPEGSLLEAGDLLATVTQLDPIRADFAIPEAHLATYGPQIRSGVGLTVLLALPDDALYPHQGQIDVTEVSVDEATGMVEVRALFPNRDVQLLPGQFVRVTLSGLIAGHGKRVPHAAVVEGPEGTAVFVVDDDNVPHMRPIQIGMDLGEDFLVTGGLSDGDRIVIGGVAGIEEGTGIRPLDSPRAAEEPVAPGLLPEVSTDLLDEVMDPATEQDAVDDILDGIGNGPDRDRASD